MQASGKSLVLVGIVALFFFGMGAIAIVNPQGLLGIFSPPLFEADMRNEVRAVYGGFGLAIGGLLVATFYNEAIRLGARLAVAVALGGMASGRVISLLIEPTDTLWPVGAIGMEATMAMMLIIARKG